MSSTKRTVLITGCSQGGIGDALAQEFNRRGYRVFATARNPNKMVHFAPEIETFTLDVLSEESIKKCVSEISSITGGSLDILVNNSGGGYSMPLADVDLTEARKLYDLNVWALLAVTQAFLPLLLKAKGTIVNQTSIVSVLNVPLTGIYNSSKAAAAMLSDNMRIELAPFGIKVVDLKTGGVKSSFFSNQLGGAKLPENSIFNIAKESVEAKLAGADMVNRGIPAAQYAKDIVAAVTKKNPPAQVWKGGESLTVWLVRTFLTHTAPDRIMAPNGALDVVTKNLKQRDAGRTKA